MNKTTPWAAIAIAALCILPTTTASSFKNPSGNYLDLGTNHVMLYDNVTGTLTDTGPAPNSVYGYGTNCYSRTDYGMVQCGQCNTYVPHDSPGTTDGKGWENNAVFGYGVCVSTDSKIYAAQYHLIARASARVTSTDINGAYWAYVINVSYSDAFGWHPVPGKIQPCPGDPMVTSCESGVFTSDVSIAYSGYQARVTVEMWGADQHYSATSLIG